MAEVPRKVEKDLDEKLRDWLMKTDNPVMPSREKEEIRKIEKDERVLPEDQPVKTSLNRMQESGVDYPAKFHRRGNLG